MIPQAEIDLTTFEEIKQPSKTFAIDFGSGRIRAKIDGSEAMRQAVQLILLTERYAYPIHSWNYGTELGDLIGKQRDLAITEVERKITEALLTDSRVRSVGDFEHTFNGGHVTVDFFVQTNYGGFYAQTEVTL